MDKFTEAEILSTCNALGSEVRGVYEKGTDCLECLRDLLQYLRKPDENHSVLRFLGSNHLIETDILPILKRYKDEKDIFDFALRLLVALTSPALLLFNEEIPVDKASHNVYLELVSYLQNYKKVFYELDIWKVLYEHLERRIALRSIERSEEDNLFIERILIVIRNILHVPSDDLASFQTDDNLSPQDKILWNLHLSKIDTIILYLCANEDEYKYCLHVVEIISLMLREHSPEILASTSEVRSEAEKEKDAQDLMVVREREQNVKLQKFRSMISSRFNGVYRVKNFKSLSDNDYIAHKLITDLDDLKFDAKKNAKRRPKNRLPFKEVNITRRSTISIRLFLKNFCKAFLKAYNKLMAAIKRELLRRGSADHDDTYYLWAIEYFMKFNRLYKFLPALVSETISLQMFHHIQTQITSYQEMMLTDKSKAKIWSRRMCLGVSAYRELLETVFTMTKSSDKNIQEIADNIVRNVFYVTEYREMLQLLLYHFDEVKFSLKYLSELVESVYMFLKMLENHSKRHSEIIVQKKKRKIKRRKKTVAVPEQSSNDESLEGKWTNIARNLSAAVQGRRDIPSGISPFDGASQLSFEEQKVDAVYKIRGALLSNEVEQAVGLLRSARELWPEGDSFGVAEIDSEDEFDVLREIYMSNLENPTQQNSAPIEEELEETDEEEESTPSYVEQKLDVNEIYKKFASAKVVIPCCLLLKNYQSNTSRTNTCLIKLIHKIAWDCKMYALFFQASVFVTFQKILEDPDVSHNPIIKEFSRFAKFILSKFFEIAEKNNKVFVELLFWKGCKEAYELEEGYGKPHPGSKKLAWTEEEEEEIKQLYEENKNIYIEGQDVGDIILANMLDKRRTKNQITLALKRLGLIQNVRDLKPHLRKEWTEDECNELRHLYEKHNMAYDMLEDISNGLSIKRPKKLIVEKLLELNLIQDRAETFKKKHLKPENTAEDDPFISDDERIIDSSDDSDLEDQDLSVKKRVLHKNIIDDSSDNDADENFFKTLEMERSENHDASNLHAKNNDIPSVTEVKKSLKHDAKKEMIRNKKTPEVWQEKEMMELIVLFNQCQGADDIINKILNSLTVKRSKRSVTEKLLELGLIKDKKEIKKRTSKSSILNGEKVNVGNSSEDDPLLSSISNTHNLTSSVVNKKKFRQIISDSSDDENQVHVLNSDENSKINDVSNSGGKIKKKNTSTKAESVEKRKRAPKIWEEQEVFELQQLFEKHKDSNDIIGNIIKEKTVKRPKDNIIGKLLEIGLINDRKEVRKKRTSKMDLSSVNKKANNKSSFVSKPQKSKNKKKSHLNSSSSEDETLPLNSLLKVNKEQHNGGLSKIKNKKGVNSESSDDEMILCELQDYLDDNSSSVIKEKEKVLENSVYETNRNAMHKNGFVKKRIGRILSDSSDDETVPLHNNISNHSLHINNVSSKHADEQVFEKSINDDFMLSNGPTENDNSPPFHSNDSHLKMKNDLDDDRVITNQKRKRFQISDSENSNDESLLNSISKIPSSTKSVDLGTVDIGSDPVKETVQLQAVRKRARVLADSDESD
ncbi:Protein timeless [Araneus ventricosus]|uniref:Protein timeless n=1 Tax=Araneus ventricosus TaxID=182803 RepID=A0A4Y2PZU1_ARAVE|nr:Protein timeless [Araneus ventricosus]